MIIVWRDVLGYCMVLYECLGMSGNVWECLEMYGNVQGTEPLRNIQLRATYVHCIDTDWGHKAWLGVATSGIATEEWGRWDRNR